MTNTGLVKFFTLWMVFTTHLLGLAIPANASLTSSHHQLANKDISPICTGQGVKWISLKAFYNTGKIVVVEAPAEKATDSDTASAQCTLCIATEISHIFISENFKALAIGQKQQQSTNASNASATYKRTYHYSLTRAPPIPF